MPNTLVPLPKLIYAGAYFRYYRLCSFTKAVTRCRVPRVRTRAGLWQRTISESVVKHASWGTPSEINITIGHKSRASQVADTVACASNSATLFGVFGLENWKHRSGHHVWYALRKTICFFVKTCNPFYIPTCITHFTFQLDLAKISAKTQKYHFLALTYKQSVVPDQA